MEWPTAAVVIAGVLALVGTLVTVRAGNARGITEREEAERKRLDARINELSDRVEELERKERTLVDYIGVLRRHVEAGSPPPPPAWPKELSL